MTSGYGQFCPIAKAAEVIGDRWNPLVLRELMFGSRHFNEISRGVPLMSRALLTRRLKELERAGVLISHAKLNGPGYEYVLTPAGEALRPLIEQMGVWAQRWGKGEIADEDLDDALLMWSLKRRVNHALLPDRRIVLQFDFRGLTKGRVTQRSWWVILQCEEVDVCQKSPGFEVDALIAADLKAFTSVWLGHTSLASALKAGTLRLAGSQDVVRQIPQWLYLNGEWLYRMGIEQPENQSDSFVATSHQ